MDVIARTVKILYPKVINHFIRRISTAFCGLNFNEFTALCVIVDYSQKAQSNT